MNHIIVGIQLLALSLFALPTGAFAQQVSPAAGNAQVTGTPAAAAQVPHLVKFTGAVKDPSRTPVSSMAGITFALYQDQQGGVPLWTENQNVQPDAAGHYTVWLGATRNEGVPVEFFASGQARWLGVQVDGQPEQARILLAAVPYALKAVDAETVGGLPPSAFLQAGAAMAAGGHAMDSNPRADSAVDSQPAVAGSGTQNYIPIWTDSAGTLGNSVLYQSGTGSTAKIGVNIATPAATLDVKGTGLIRGTLSLPATGAATALAGKNSQPQNFAASAFNSSTSKAVSQTFQWQAEPASNNTATPSATLNLLFGLGTSTPAETGLKIASNGQITFPAGQTFPGAGTGTVTNVGSGGGLTGGPITGSGTLSIATGGVTNTMLANPSLTVAAGTDLTGGGAVALGGSTTLNLDTTKVPLLASANTFTGNQTVNGNLSATGTVTGSSFGIGSKLFAFGSDFFGNVFLGFSGNVNTTGTNNTASGTLSLYSNNTGSNNTASGNLSLYSNNTGSNNTASGYQALYNNTIGSNNIAIGYNAGFNVTTSNNIDIGDQGTASDNQTIRIGTAGAQTSTFIAGIYGVNTSGIPVYINNYGQLGTVASSRRYKEDIQDMGDTSSGLLRLRPVTFRYRKPYSDGSQPIQYGLIAEEVAEVYPDLVARSADGQIETVKYQLLDSMLLNELQKQNATIAAQKEQIRSLEQRLAKVEAALAGASVTTSSP